MSLNIFLIYIIFINYAVCIDFYDLSVWCGCWFVVYIRRFIYKFLNVCPFDYTAVAGSWVAVVTPTDRPKSVRNCRLIELFCGVVCVVTLSLSHFCWFRGFCHRTGSDLLLFVLSCLRNRLSFEHPSILVLLFCLEQDKFGSDVSQY